MKIRMSIIERIQQYDRLLLKQNYKCYICGKSLTKATHGVQKAHFYSNSKVNRRIYGDKLNSDEAACMVDSLECNHKAARGEASMKQKDDFFRGI